MKVLLFPGSFNPCHFGHIRLLRAAIEEVKPDVSVISPVYRSSADQPDFATRSEIARMAVNNTMPLPLSEMVEVGTFHTTRDDASMFHESLMFYRDKYDSTNGKPEVWILMGSEGAREAAKWKFAKQLSQVAGIVASRDASQPDLDRLQGKGFAVRSVPFKPSTMSAERVRAVLAKGQQDSWRYVPRAVFHLLKERGLYGAGRVGEGCRS